MMDLPASSSFLNIHISEKPVSCGDIFPNIRFEHRSLILKPVPCCRHVDENPSYYQICPFQSFSIFEIQKEKTYRSLILKANFPSLIFSLWQTLTYSEILTGCQRWQMGMYFWSLVTSGPHAGERPEARYSQWASRVRLQRAGARSSHRAWRFVACDPCRFWFLLIGW